MQGFFFDGELVKFGFNWSMGVDGSSHIFTHYDYWTSHGNMLAKRTDCHSLMNCSLVTTSRGGSLDCYLVIFFSSLPWTGCGFGESTNVSSSDKGN